MLATRNLLYTGVTRGKRAVILVGSENKMHAMVDNNRITERYSGLAARLRAFPYGRPDLRLDYEGYFVGSGEGLLDLIYPSNMILYQLWEYY